VKYDCIYIIVFRSTYLIENSTHLIYKFQFSNPLALDFPTQRSTLQKINATNDLFCKVG